MVEISPSSSSTESSFAERVAPTSTDSHISSVKISWTVNIFTVDCTCGILYMDDKFFYKITYSCITLKHAFKFAMMLLRH